MGDLRIGGAGSSGIERFQSLREEALRRSRSTAAAGAVFAGKNPALGSAASAPATETRAASSTQGATPVPDTRSPLGRLIDLRA